MSQKRTEELVSKEQLDQTNAIFFTYNKEETHLGIGAVMPDDLPHHVMMEVASLAR